MQPIEIEAKTVEEAIAIACEKFQTTESSLNIEIVENSPNKILSLFSGKKARIKVTRADAQNDLEQDSAVPCLRETLETIARYIHHEASVQVETGQDENVLNIIGDGSGIFIGKRGQTLEALQYIINKVRMNKFRTSPHITVDSESYRSRHIESLVSLAERLSIKAKKRNGPVTTNPLSPGDRRIIHMTLKKDTDLTTWSKGQGNLKKVIIAPRDSSKNQEKCITGTP